MCLFCNDIFIDLYRTHVILFFGPKGSEIDLLIREEGIGYCGWPEKWDRTTLIEMGRKARALAESEYSESVILDKFLKAI